MPTVVGSRPKLRARLTNGHPMQPDTIHRCLIFITLLSGQLLIASCDAPSPGDAGIEDGATLPELDSGARSDAGTLLDSSTLPGEDTLARCSDLIDNDEDSAVDCNDLDCCAVRRDCPTGTRCGDEG